jgi:hypothetical protein
MRYVWIGIKEKRSKKGKSRYSFNNAMKNEIFTRENSFLDYYQVRPFHHSFIQFNPQKLIQFAPFIAPFGNSFSPWFVIEEMHFL